MATRPDETAKSKKRAAPAARKAPAAAKKTAARKTASKAQHGSGEQPRKAEGLLRAGLKALDNVRNDVAKRQANVIEGLLGIGQGKVPSLGLDSFGIRKFEDVFDQRVATAMQRLGMPDAAEVQALRDEVAQLRERVAQLEAGAGAGISRGRGRR
ncbi:phasin family protein [uncultured Variovorax sp.]|uniref:phasin family protein n=1 Tax=uncultured Variovorax sp. TaxID=114708 RepID=UPI0025D16040|nr:phasin family protein [uncultured Variovorax sp.]